MQPKKPPEEEKKKDDNAQTTTVRPYASTLVPDIHLATLMSRGEISPLANPSIAVSTVPTPQFIGKHSQFDSRYSALFSPSHTESLATVSIPNYFATPERKEMTSEEVEKIAKTVMEQNFGRTEEKSDKFSREEILTSVLPEIIQRLETHKKEAESVIGEEDASFLSQKFVNGEYIKWKCKECGTFIARLDSLAVVADYLKKFSEGAMVHCSKYGHLNRFKINKGTIIWEIETEIGSKFLWKKD